MKKTHWVRVTLTDSQGDWDVGNMGLACLIVIVLGTVPYIWVMSTLAAHDVTIHFVADEIGSAVGKICAGFAAALGALGVYRVGDAKRPPSDPVPPKAPDGNP